MKSLKSAWFFVAIFIATGAYAMPAEHPASADAAVPTFRPADFFVAEGPSAAAESGHQHGNNAVSAVPDAATGHEHEAEGQDAAGGAKEDGKGCKRGGCCCCKCCDKADEAEPAGKKGCGMMKEGMMEKGGKTAPKSGDRQGEGHEAHH